MITKHPLVLNITNSVTVNFVADALLAVGAAPVMSEDPTDATELVPIVNGICINIGTINTHQRSIIDKVLSTNSKSKITLDPVGAGATATRTKACLDILATGKVNLIRGNASEISSLAGKNHSTRGVDSTESTLSVKDSAFYLATEYKCIVVVSGEVDLLTDGKNMSRTYNGSALMPKITGTGCVLSAFLTAVISDHEVSLADLTQAVAYYGYMGEIAESLAKGTGTFKERFLDALYQIKVSEVQENLRIEML
ncbi:hydroxyethylthiazole kinase [Leptospira sp. GIMC2001]|uniref:hydroxyethylthiazole kinase n=1 Tax=Leptospira sp. GIMC2001 TaxID=1513297 RepID=UPI00234AA4F6|nr:hydroxyethylthiazole kinase [Leptospira sp. GIMC2001]WCL47806.1 hydroxyethylthiazole kinase [Leptospira sp. GIMC2001]